MDNECHIHTHIQQTSIHNNNLKKNKKKTNFEFRFLTLHKKSWYIFIEIKIHSYTSKDTPSELSSLKENNKVIKGNRWLLTIRAAEDGNHSHKKKKKAKQTVSPAFIHSKPH
ncbi:hypothetical protein XENOCAPTIV_015312 [Xenoophorus captivus]|uniref:Uncharacterized protein n=1 Tax=Xenoophorus captivus TaxID=1517983 RepID=A0ABV0RU63_9TELE